MAIKEYSTESSDRDLIVFARAFRQTSAFQSLASLVQAMDKLGRRVHLITQSEPGGDDYVSCESMKRYAIDVYETRGYSTEEAFVKIVSEIPAKTIIFVGDLYGKTIQFFQTAQRMGRCTIWDTDRSPLYYIGSGSEKLSMTCMYMIRYADCVISHSETDCNMIRSMGANNCVYLPFYFPYFDKEVGAAQFEGGRFVYYTTYAGRNTRAAITAFSLVHDRFPDARMTVVCVGVRKSAVREELERDIRDTSLSEYIDIEPEVLKPLRFLRTADVSLTYAHLITMPETVMESISAGIPAIVLRDGDFSADTDVSIPVCASDVDAIAAQMLRFMEKKECEAYSEKARALLDVHYREALAAQYSAQIDATLQAYNESLKEAEKCLASYTKWIAGETDNAKAVRKLRLDGVCADAIYVVLLLFGRSYDAIVQAFRDSEVCQKDALRLQMRADIFSSFVMTDAAAYKNRKIIPADFAARLAACGLGVRQIADFYNISLSSGQVSRALLRCVPTELCLRDFNAADGNGVVSTAMQSFKSFNMENARYSRTKTNPGLQRAMKYYDWKSRPYSQHGILGKLYLLPGRALDRFKKFVQMHGRQRLLKRKVVEVEPADVRKIQLMVLKLMLEFERICKKHNLTYYLAGGTILGAVRHGGFIPWDDDMDITMPRPDYDKFLKIAKKELSPEFKLDKDCVPFCHNRIEYKDSRFDTAWRNGGIFLDILALDGSPDDEKTRRKHEAKTKFWRFWMLEKARPIPALSASRDVQMIWLKRVIARMMPRWFLKWRWYSWAARYDCDKVSSWVCLPASIYTYEQERFPKEYWGEPVMLEFEGYEMPTMQHWEDYLICHFGNYRKMPPETLRKSHHFIYNYDLGKYKDISTEELEKELLGPKAKAQEAQKI